MLPDAEVDTLLMAAHEARALAAVGRLADGYAVLIAGLHHALGARDIGEPWARELIRYYEVVLRGYLASYGVRLK